MTDLPYDQPEFFAEYAAMRKRADNFNDHAVEPAIAQLLPDDLRGKTALDLGCGWGDHCRRFAERGAQVTGVDPSETMLAEARKSNAAAGVAYQRATFEECEFAPASFDLVFSCLVAHYIEDFPALFERVAAWLKPGGVVVFIMEHPVNTAAIHDNGWHKDAQGKRLHWRLNDYFSQGARTSGWLGAQVPKFHHTMETVLNAVIGADLAVERVLEPRPSGEAVKRHGELAKGLAYPMFLALRARKRSR